MPHFLLATRMLVRCDEDGKLYLYDHARTKKKMTDKLVCGIM